MFADDIAIKFKIQEELLEIIQSLENLGPSYNLKLNRNKTKFLNESSHFKNIEEIQGIGKTREYNYLGFKLSSQTKINISSFIKNIEKSLIITG